MDSTSSARSSEPWDGWLLRPAEPADAAEVVGVHLAARAAAVAAGLMPPGVRSEGEVRDWLTARLAADETWVAERDGAVVAYLRLTPTWLDDLYVHPDHRGTGIGSALLDLALSLRPGGLGLYVFETNVVARVLYESRGFVVTERTDESENEERAPDLRMEWSGTRP